MSGVRSEILSNEIVVARDAPSVGEVTLYTPAGRDEGTIQTAADATVRVRGFLEPYIGIDFFELCLGTQTNVHDVMPCVNSTHVPQQDLKIGVAFGGLLLPQNESHSLVATARACSPVGECTSTVSNSLQVDVDDPLGGFVADGLLAPDEIPDADVIAIACDQGSACYGWPLVGVGGIGAVDRMNVDVADLTLPTSAVNNLTRQMRGTMLAATWGGGFADGFSGIARIEVCFGSTPGTGDLVPCTPMEDENGLPLREGVAIAQPRDLPSGITYFATVRAFDKAARNATATSAGLIYFNAPPQTTPLVLDEGEANGFAAQCGTIGASWDAFGDPGCETPIRYTWQVCTPALCTEATVLPRSHRVSVNASTSDATLDAGVQYVLRVSAVGCSGLEAIQWSRGVVCDETDPEVVGSPTLTSPYGRTALADGDTVTVAWRQVFEERDSLLVSSEVCLTGLPVDCVPTSWTPVPDEWYRVEREDSLNITLNLSDARLASLDTIYAVVRVKNNLNASAEATSGGMPIERLLPKLTSFSVDGFSSTIPTIPCTLNRTFSLPAAWGTQPGSASSLTYRLAAAEAATPIPVEIVTRGVEVGGSSFEATSSDEIVLSQVGPQIGRDGLTRALHPLGNGSVVTFALTATTRSGRADSTSLTCTVCNAEPAGGTLAVVDRQPMLSGTYAAATQAAQTDSPAGTPRLCWSGFDLGSVCGPFTYRLWWTLATTDQSLGDATIAGNETCVEDTPLLAHGATYVVRVEATGVSGLLSAPASVRIVADETPPKPVAEETVVIGGIGSGAPPPGRFSSVGCCARIGWQLWIEAETTVMAYTLCLRTASNGTQTNQTTSNCFDLAGDTDSVLVQQMGCDCSGLSASTTWTLDAESSYRAVAFSAKLSAVNAADLRYTNDAFVLMLGSEHLFPVLELLSPSEDTGPLCEAPSFAGDAPVEVPCSAACPQPPRSFAHTPSLSLDLFLLSPSPRGPVCARFSSLRPR